MGACSPGASVPFLGNIRGALDSAKRRDAVIEGCENKCDPLSERKDIIAVRPWIVDWRRASSAELRSACFRAKRHVRPARRVGERQRGAAGRYVTFVNVGPVALFWYACGTSGVRLSVADRIRFCRAPHLKYKYLLAGNATWLDHFRRVAEETRSPLVSAAAQERKFIFEALRISYTPHAPSGEGLAPPATRLGGLATASGIMRTVSRMVGDAARADTPLSRVFDACYGFLAK